MPLWSRAKEPDADVVRADRIPYISMTELMENYDLDQVGGNIVATRKLAIQTDQTPISYTELGTTGGRTSWGHMARAEYNPQLFGSLGLQKYDEMRRSDAAVKRSLRLIKAPLLGARWYIEPPTQSKQDQKVAEFVWNSLTRYMTCSWYQVLVETMLMLDFGYYMFEKVFQVRDGKIVWRKFAPRHPMDVDEWAFDSNGGPSGVWMVDERKDDQRTFITIGDLIVFTNEKEANNVEGISVLRAAYKHWYFKENLYKIDAIQKERHGIGIPVIVLPPNFTPQDKLLAEQMGSNIRTNEKAHIILPPGWELSMLKLEGHPVDVMASIEHHSREIMGNVLGAFLEAATSSQGEDVRVQMFLHATRHLADIIRDVFNKYAIPQLVDYNWKTVDTYPELKVRRLGEERDIRTMSFAIRNLVGASVLVPDDKLEQYVRDEMELPAADPATAREASTPQLPGGSPRQSQAGNQRSTQGTGAGDDRSGGTK